MKRSLTLATSAGLLCAGFLFLHAAAGKLPGGPQGGRLLEKTEPLAEFVVGKDRIVTIHFYNPDLKAVPVTTQSVSVVADGKGVKTKLEFEKKGDSLVSKTKLPEGDGYPVVVQFQRTAGARPQNFRFKLELHTCGECQRAEYACICDH